MGAMATSELEELEFLKSWEPLPGQPPLRIFEQLVNFEFLDSDQQQARLTNKIQNTLKYATREISYYRNLFEKLSLKAADFRSLADLGRIPVLTRFDIVNFFEYLRAQKLGVYQKDFFTTKTSGSTGLPVKTLLTRHNKSMFAIYGQRQARWFRLDISQRFARIRIPPDLFRTPDGQLNPDGNTTSSPVWMNAGFFYKTGDEVNFNVSNPRQAQLDWLEKYQPTYLLTYPGLLEELALANNCQSLPYLKALLPVSSMLTTAMRARIDQSFGIPIYQNYGLNEVGIVAVQCNAGRYHVHTEQALVEIVDAEGQAVSAGESGRLLVTTLSNSAMPLIRYDTGDIATATEGPCLCGRTLPSFKNILGRHIRFAGTPEQTRPLLNGLLSVITDMPNEYFTNIHQYQIYQSKQENFEFRVVTVGDMHEAFESTLQATWRMLNSDDGARKLSFVHVDEIEATPSGKQLDFVSAFHTLESDFKTDNSHRT